MTDPHEDEVKPELLEWADPEHDVIGDLSEAAENAHDAYRDGSDGPWPPDALTGIPSEQA